MSSILDALRKLEQEKVEVIRPIEVDYNEEVAERDLIGGMRRDSAPGRVSPFWLGLLGAASVLILAGASAGGAVLWMRAQSPGNQVAAASVVTPTVQTASMLPSTATPVAPAPKMEEVSTVAAASDPDPPVSTVVDVMEPVPFVPETAPRVMEARSPMLQTVHDRPAPTPKKSTRELAAREAPVDVVEEDLKPSPPPEEPRNRVKAPKAVAPAPEPESYVPVPSTSSPLPDIPAEAPAAAPPIAPGAPVPMAPAEEQTSIKVNMPRPANETRPYDSAIINMQAVFLNEIIPGTNSRLVKVREDGVEVLNETSNRRYYIPF